VRGGRLRGSGELGVRRVKWASGDGSARADLRGCALHAGWAGGRKGEGREWGLEGAWINDHFMLALAGAASP